jgi:hypothetical protein
LSVAVVALLADKEGVEIAFLAVYVVAVEQALLPCDCVDDVLLLALPALKIALFDTEKNAVGKICCITYAGVKFNKVAGFAFFAICCRVETDVAIFFAALNFACLFGRVVNVERRPADQTCGHVQVAGSAVANVAWILSAIRVDAVI